jgi:hypothetical protein
MAARQTYHVIYDLKGGWRVVRRGSERASRHFEVKEDAIEWGRQASRNQGIDFVVHRRDGTVESEDSFGRDSLRSRDRDSRQ